MVRILAYCKECSQELYEADISVSMPSMGSDETTVLVCPNCDKITPLFSDTIA
jgi:hypothetical protein